MTLFKTTIWQTLALYTNTSSRKDTKDTFSIVVFILFLFLLPYIYTVVHWNCSKLLIALISPLFKLICLNCCCGSDWFNGVIKTGTRDPNQRRHCCQEPTTVPWNTSPSYSVIIYQILLLSWV